MASRICNNCVHENPEESLFCNKCGSKLTSGNSKPIELHNEGSTPVSVKISDDINANEKDKFPVKALIIIIIIVLIAGLSGLYNHYMDEKEIKATKITLRNQEKLYSYIREANWEEAKLFIENTDANNVTNIDDIDYLSLYINARYNYGQINDDEKHNKEIFDKIDGVWYELMDYEGEFKEDIKNFNIEYIKIRWKYDELEEKFGSGSNNTSSPTLEEDTDINEEYSKETWDKTAGSTTGYDWLKMYNAQKKDIVEGVILDWKSNNFDVSVSSTYFISALNAFYGDVSTNSTNLAEAMSMIGLSGNVLSKK
ncbi:zinc ribbon domain-containing protein [Paenibacillus sp. FSL L8-0436]|uniref:zinc ribbon domain-containing protein n=1 Tax=Paenibacillus sp. FSL L8-0436 TaxID=2954686 RepID=UPI0031585347